MAPASGSHCDKQQVRQEVVLLAGVYPVERLWVLMFALADVNNNWTISRCLSREIGVSKF